MDDSGLIVYRYPLSGIVMYSEAEQRENDNGKQS